MTWTAERIEQLRKLWDDGYSTTRIGMALDCTKNAVIGKAHRLKLPPRVRNIREAALMGGYALRELRRIQKEGQVRVGSGQLRAIQKKRKALTLAPKPEPTPPAPILAPTSAPVTLLDIGPLQCRYVIGDANGPQTMMCGAPIDRNSLCAFHVHLCWTPAPKKGNGMATRGWQAAA